MARKNPEELKKQNEELSLSKELIDEYGSQNDRLKLLKKSCETQNNALKELMNKFVKADEDGTRIAEGNDYIAVLSVRDNSTMNEEKLIKWLKKNGLSKGIIKKKEYVDSDALSDAIYKGKISDELVLDMESCKDLKPTTVLNVKKKKKGAK